MIFKHKPTQNNETLKKQAKTSLIKKLYIYIYILTQTKRKDKLLENDLTQKKNKINLKKIKILHYPIATVKSQTEVTLSTVTHANRKHCW